MKKLLILLSILLLNVACKSNTVEPIETTEITVAAEPIQMLDVEMVVNQLTNDMDISDQEKLDLLFMREEEKLAGDVYRKYYELHNLRTFINISYSEDRHTEAIRVLLEQFGIADPVKGEGEFSDSDLQNLYDNLVSSGSESIENAISNGILIEEKDIYDLQEKIANTENEDIKTVYGYLLKGSENHLRAYMRQASNYGINYEPQFLTSEQIDEIVSSSGNSRRGKGYRGGR